MHRAINGRHFLCKIHEFDCKHPGSDHECTTTNLGTSLVDQRDGEFGDLDSFDAFYQRT